MTLFRFLFILCLALSGCYDSHSSRTRTETDGGVSGLLVQISPMNLPGRVVGKNSTGVRLLSLDLTAIGDTVTVTYLDVLRSGSGSHQEIQNIYIIDEDGHRLTSGRNVNSVTGRVVFNNLSIVIESGTSRSLHFQIDLSSPVITGGTHQLELESVQASSPVQGVLPIQGNVFTVGEFAVGAVNFSAFSTPFPRANEESTVIANIGLYAPSTGFFLNKLELVMTGTESPSSITNPRLTVDGAVLAEGVWYDDKLLFVFDEAWQIPYPLIQTMRVIADLNGTPGRTISFSLEYPNDAFTFDENRFIYAQTCISSEQVNCSSNALFDGSGPARSTSITLQP